MIIGIGIDIVDIRSFTESFNKSKRFRQKIFTEVEIAYCESKLNKYQHYATRFAAKEATMKAMSTGWDKGVQWKQIETKRNGDGKPEIILNGKALELTKEMGVDKIFISLSHSEMQAVAIVVLESKK